MAPGKVSDYAKHTTVQSHVGFTDWDFGVCLQYECRRKQLRKPGELSSWIDLRATYRVSAGIYYRHEIAK